MEFSAKWQMSGSQPSASSDQQKQRYETAEQGRA